MTKYIIYFWKHHDFTKACGFFDDNDCIKFDTDYFYDSLMDEDNTHGQADCQTFDTIEEAKAVFEEIKSKCNIRVLTSRRIKNGIEADIRVDMCEIAADEFDEDGDLIGSESIEFYTKELTITLDENGDRNYEITE